MAKGKNKIVVYADWIDSFEDLSNEEAGILIKHFFKYVNDQNPVLEDRVLKATWKPIERTLKRDLKKWEEMCEKRSKAGKASANKRKQLQRMLTLVDTCEHDSTNPTDKDTDTDTDTDTDISSNKLDDDVLYNVEDLKNNYLNNTQVCEAIISNKENKIANIDDLKYKLDCFNKHLKEQGRLSETQKEYTKYFRNCCKKGMFKKDGVTIDNFNGNIYNDIYGT